MNGPDRSTAPIPELALLTGASGPARPWPATPGSDPTAGDPPAAAHDGPPDAEIAIANSLVRVHAMFQVDPKTKEVQVSVVDDRGRLIRIIPPDSVAQMIAAMASYARRV